MKLLHSLALSILISLNPIKAQSQPDLTYTPGQDAHALEILIQQFERQAYDMDQVGRPHKLLDLFIDQTREGRNAIDENTAVRVSGEVAELTYEIDNAATNLTRGIQPGRDGAAGCRSRSTGRMTSCDSMLPVNLNYGCWCHEDSTDIFKGSGPFMDEFDKACKMYKQCLRCVRHDSRQAGEVCDPGTVSYQTDNQKSKKGIHMECSSKNSDDCSAHTCCCDLDYVRTVLKLFIVDGIQLKDHYKHGAFDYETECKGNGPTGHTRDCCGEYPKRRMYSTNNKDCCNDKSIYDPYTHVCCEDGESAINASECTNPTRSRKKRRAQKKQESLRTLGFYNM